MTDDRTPEQKAASENLLDAIQQVIRLRAGDDSSAVVEDFVVTCSVNSIELMERGSTEYAYITRNDGQGHYAQPAHACIGLLRMGLNWFEDV